MTSAGLHTRIAAAIAARIEGMRGNQRAATPADLADAVLDALKLHRETRPGIVRASGKFVDGPVENRYVTDWTVG